MYTRMHIPEICTKYSLRNKDPKSMQYIHLSFVLLPTFRLYAFVFSKNKSFFLFHFY